MYDIGNRSSCGLMDKALPPKEEIQGSSPCSSTALMSKALQSKKGKKCSSARSGMAPAAGAGSCPLFFGFEKHMS